MDTQTEQEYTLQDIIEASFDFSNYSEEDKNAVIEESAAMIMEATLLRSVGELGDEVGEKFSNFMDTNPTQEAMMQFVSENLPNFNQILAEEIQFFQNIGSQEKTDA